MIKISIPERIDLEELERKIEPKKLIKHYKKDKLAYILHLFNHIPSCNKRYVCSNRFVPLNAEILQDSISNYNQYLNMLIKYGYVECDNSYIKGEKSRWYKLTDQYAVGVKPYVITNWTFYRNLEAVFDKMQKGSKSKYPNLKQWFNDKLELNMEAADNFITQDYEIKTMYPELREQKHKGFKDPITQFNAACYHMEKYAENDLNHFTVDTSGLRFHSLLTNTRKALRNLLTYDGKEVTSLDISNSQPYFSTLLFNVTFWQYASTNKRYKKIYDKILLNNHYNDSLIMLQTISESLAAPDVQRYMQLVVSGDFYEEFEKEYIKEYGAPHNSRADLKAEMFLVLFSDNTFIGRPNTKGKDLFKKLFPNVYAVFKMIKKHDKTLLPLLLQRIESDIVLEDICAVMAEKHPSVPIFTIHDSIATTSDNVFILKSVMEERLKHRMGTCPKLKAETWCLANLEKELYDLKAKIPMAA